MYPVGHTQEEVEDTHVPTPDQEVVSQKEHGGHTSVVGGSTAPADTHTDRSTVVLVPLAAVATQVRLRLRVPPHPVQGENGDAVTEYDTQGRVPHTTEAAGASPASAQSVPGCALTAWVVVLTHWTGRTAMPPPHVTEHAPKSPLVHVYPPAHACVLQDAARSLLVAVGHRDRGTAAPVRLLTHTGDRHLWPPPQDTEHAENGVYASA